MPRSSMLAETDSARGSTRRPRLVIAGGAGAAPALVVVPRRAVRVRRAGQIGNVVLLPGAARRAARHRRLLDDVVQPQVPFRRAGGGFRSTAVEHPALLAAAGEAARTRLVAKILVADGVAADARAAQPRIDPGRNGHRVRK